MRENLPVSDVERLVPSGEVLVSKTDINGTITYCNRIFSEISGYDYGEMLGHPHNLIRHPSMPEAVYADCWRTIKAGLPWRGLLKNRCKNGDYYWVDANITPWLEKGVKAGYVSLRYKATEIQIKEAEAAYRVMNAGGVAKQTHKPEPGYIIELQQRLARKIMALETYRLRSEEELRIGSDIMARINRVNDMQDASVRQLCLPAGHYSGDMLLVMRTPVNVLHLLLADAVGHGLPAAINVLPLSQTFYRMTEMGFEISRIVHELNDTINRYMPADRFVAATLISIDGRDNVIEVWNGGNPASVLLNSDGDIIKTWESRNLPLGILSPQEFSVVTEKFYFDDACQLFVYSDGLQEAESPEGVPFDDKQVHALLRSNPPATRFDALTTALNVHLAGGFAHDDISLAMVAVNPPFDRIAPSRRLGAQLPDGLDTGWRFSISLGANELKYIEVVPLFTKIITNINATKEHYSALFLILSELFNNALDHGVLGLDSSIKQGMDGFEKYFELRDARLRALQRGNIDLGIEKVLIDGMYAVKIRIADSGNGFDYAGLEDVDNHLSAQTQYGRGIALVKGLAYKIDFAQQGREVIVYYVCYNLNSQNAI